MIKIDVSENNLNQIYKTINKDKHDMLDSDIREIYKPDNEVAVKCLDCKLSMMVAGKLGNAWGRMWEGQA